MGKFIIYYDYSETTKKYIESIYRNSISTDEDIGDAIEFTNKDTAICVKNFLNERDNTSKYKVMSIKTSYEIIE